VDVRRCRRFVERTGLGIDENSSRSDGDLVGGDALLEWRRTASILDAVLPAVPRAGDAAIDDSALSERTALVGANVCDGRDASVVLEDGDAFAAAGADDDGAALGYVIHGTDVEQTIVGGTDRIEILDYFASA
jgi:hypothetical protein